MDTSKINKQRHNLEALSEIWLFGYGSLIHKVDFPFIEKRTAIVDGWCRRFWQGSHDHRGTPQNPGRVLTLIESPGESCLGMAFKVSHQVFEHLDHREKNGYLRHDIELKFDDGSVKNGLVYIAEPGNAAYLGPATDTAIAEHIISSVGPSGENTDYVLRLAAALRKLGTVDEHVFAIEREIKRLTG